MAGHLIKFVSYLLEENHKIVLAFSKEKPAGSYRTIEGLLKSITDFFGKKYSNHITNIRFSDNGNIWITYNLEFDDAYRFRLMLEMELFEVFGAIRASSLDQVRTSRDTGPGQVPYYSPKNWSKETNSITSGELHDNFQNYLERVEKGEIFYIEIPNKGLYRTAKLSANSADLILTGKVIPISLNLRDAPDAGLVPSNVIGFLREGDLLNINKHVASENDSTWYFVSIKDKSGWVDAKYVQLSKPLGITLEYFGGQLFTVLDRVGDGEFFEIKRNIGWVTIAKLSPIPETEQKATYIGKTFSESTYSSSVIDPQKEAWNKFQNLVTAASVQ